MGIISAEAAAAAGRDAVGEVEATAVVEDAGESMKAMKAAGSGVDELESLGIRLAE